jgi:hypothetical protein
VLAVTHIGHYLETFRQLAKKNAKPLTKPRTPINDEQAK